MSTRPAADPAAWGTDARALFAQARDPARLTTAVMRFHRTVDAVMAASFTGHGIAVECAKGCSFCCHLRLEVQPAEAFAIADWLQRHLSPERLQEVVRRLRENVATTQALGTERRKRASLACALLEADGACGAYEVRPAQCRRYHSVRRATCASFHANPADERLESPLHPAAAHNAAVLITQAQHATRETGLDATNVDFNFALLEALENPKARRRWKDGKKPFARS